MFKLYRRLKWVYQRFKLSAWVPFAALVSYTVFGAFLFKSFEMENDQRNREQYRNRTVYAMNQVIERMLEVRCHDLELRTADKAYQKEHAKEAIIWFLEHLNLTEVLNERTEDSPWTWLGSMFYAGQLYTTIGYGYPATSTAAGRVASIFYILFGIPIFLIILKDIGRVMSRGCRKLYKRLRTSRRKIADSKSAQSVSQFFSRFYKSATLTNINGHTNKQDPGLDPEQENKVNARLHAENAFPIPIALSMLILWILFSAALFCYWESEWGYLTSVYFFFVSISTVGLGDIVFMNPDMMIFNFLLILIGLALLSMCFNLIQAALERLLDRLLEEYIEEIEKMAEIVANDELDQEEVAPLEMRMTGNLISLPMKKVSRDTGFFAEAKEWMAGRIANNLLISRLGPSEDSDSDVEEQQVAPHIDEEAPTLKVTTVPSHLHTVGGDEVVGAIESPHHLRIAVDRFQIRHNRPLFNTVRTLETIKPHKGDFRSIVFSKFLQSERLNRIVEETPPQPPKRMVTTCCQTDEVPRVHQPSVGRGTSTSSSSSMTRSRSVGFDEESLMSSAYCDIRFDCSSEFPAASRQHSSFSVLKVEDEEPQLPSMAAQQAWSTPWKPLPKLTLEKVDSVLELPSPVSPNMLTRRCPSCSSLREKPDHPSSDEVFERVRSVCGLLPSDFDTRSTSSRSTMMDSGYGKSHHEDVHRPLSAAFSPTWIKSTEDPTTVDEERAEELRKVVMESGLSINLEDAKEDTTSSTTTTTTSAA